MPIVRIEHSVPNFEKWKEAFDRDPADRKGSGVHRWNARNSEPGERSRGPTGFHPLHAPDRVQKLDGI